MTAAHRLACGARLLLVLIMSGLFLPARAQAPAAETLRFAIWEYVIEGNTVLPVTVVEAAVLPFLGEDRSLADVEAARTTLEKAYQAAGFLSVFVDIPEQSVDEGIVQLRVTEGRVERLAVTGARYFDQGRIRRALPALAPGQVPNFNALQQQLSAVNREERQLQPVLRPGNAPGTLEAEVKVTDRLPYSANVELNNNHAADTKPLRLQATLRYDNLFQREHGLALTLITAPQDTQQSRVLAANYSAPLAAEWTLLASALWSDSVVEPLGTATVFGKGFSFGLRAARSFNGPDSVNTLVLGAEYKHLKEDLEAGGDTLSTPLRYLPFSVAYSGSWAGRGSSTSLNLQFTGAWRQLLARDLECPGTVGLVDQFACKREGGDGSFGHARADLRHSGAAFGLPGTLSWRLGAQLALQPLVSAEQYAIGGADTVRGYLEAEGSGDRGLLGSAEWRSPNLLPARAAGSGFGLDELALGAFVDVARVWVDQPSVGQAGRISLLGSGLGLRLRAARQLNADLDIAWPQKSTARSLAHHARLHLRLRAQF